MSLRLCDLLSSPFSPHIHNVKPRRNVGPYTETEEGYLITHPETKELYLVNKVGFEILKLCDGTRSVHDIVSEISSRYSVSYEEALRDVLKFLCQLEQEGLITAESYE